MSSKVIRVNWGDSMRNPGRIDACLGWLGEAWKQVPDMRLGQLLENAGVGFYTEDVEAMSKVTAFVEKVKGKTYEENHG